MDTATTLDKGHGRIERRTLKATTALNDYLDWPGVGQVGQVESEVVKDGKTSHEIRYFITSVSRPVAGAGQLLKWARGHWSVENRSHYYPGTEEAHTNPTRQRGECLRALAGASG